VEDLKYDWRRVVMWFSHLTGPLGPRIRTHCKFILDVVSGHYEGLSLGSFANHFTLECLGSDDVGNLMKLSYIDPDVLDVIKDSRDALAIVASYCK